MGIPRDSHLFCPLRPHATGGREACFPSQAPFGGSWNGKEAPASPLFCNGPKAPAFLKTGEAGHPFAGQRKGSAGSSGDPKDGPQDVARQDAYSLQRAVNVPLIFAGPENRG